MKIDSYKELVVWQKSMDLVEVVYALTKNFPDEEAYGLTFQIKRAAVSIPSNISEGSNRGTRKDFRNFLFNAFGSGAELETQLEIAKRLRFVTVDDCDALEKLLDEVMRMPNKLISQLGKKV